MATANKLLIDKPLFLEASGTDNPVIYHAEDMRTLVGAVFPRYGRLGYGSSYQILPKAAGADWSIDVAPGLFIVGDTNEVTNSPQRYLVKNAIRTNVPLIGTGWQLAPTAKRTHKVWLCLDDPSIGGPASTYQARIMITEDIGAGAPPPSGTSDLYHLLGTFTISPGQSTINTAQIFQSYVRSDNGIAALDVDLATGMVDPSGTIPIGPPRFTLSGNTIRYQGGIKRTGSATFTTNVPYLVGNMPYGYRPPLYPRVMAGTGYLGNMWRLTVEENGDMTAQPYAGNSEAMTWLGLDGLSYELNY